MTRWRARPIYMFDPSFAQIYPECQQLGPYVAEKTN